jgi:hypothetical protein
MTEEQKIIRAKVGLLELATPLRASGSRRCSSRLGRAGLRGPDDDARAGRCKVAVTGNAPIVRFPPRT